MLDLATTLNILKTMFSMEHVIKFKPIKLCPMPIIMHVRRRLIDTLWCRGAQNLSLTQFGHIFSPQSGELHLYLNLKFETNCIIWEFVKHVSFDEEDNISTMNVIRFFLFFFFFLGGGDLMDMILWLGRVKWGLVTFNESIQLRYALWRIVVSNVSMISAYTLTKKQIVSNVNLKLMWGYL